MVKPVVLLLALLSPSVSTHSDAASTEVPNPAKVALVTKAPANDTWNIDVSHSELTFSVRHLISRVRGQFGKWEGTIKADPEDWSKASVEVQIQTASINTNNERRDNHLRNSDFFEVEKHPAITFKSTKVERKGDSITLNGNLTMRGVTKPVVLKGKFNGMTKGQNGKYRAGFEVSTVINRMDYGVAWNRAAEAGGMTLGDEVTIDISVAAVQQ